MRPNIWSLEPYRCARDDYGPLPPGFRLVTFVVSTFGSFGPAAQTLLRDLGRRVGRGVPLSLLDESTWAAPSFAPFARMAVGCAVRRGLAEAIKRRWKRRLRDGGAGGGAGGEQGGGAGGGAGGVLTPLTTLNS